MTDMLFSTRRSIEPAEKSSGLAPKHVDNFESVSPSHRRLFEAWEYLNKGDSTKSLLIDSIINNPTQEHFDGATALLLWLATPDGQRFFGIAVEDARLFHKSQRELELTGLSWSNYENETPNTLHESKKEFVLDVVTETAKNIGLPKTKLAIFAKTIANLVWRFTGGEFSVPPKAMAGAERDISLRDDE